MKKTPKGAIIYLSRSTSDDLRDLRKSLHLLQKNFNARFGYPVIVFHEDLSATQQKEIASWVSSPVRFARVDFRLPSFIDESRVPTKFLGRFSVGYRHMCRFFAGEIYHHPALAEFDWYWRLDTDSFLLEAVSYDVFALMEDRGLLYGFIAQLDEKPEVVDGLWTTTVSYLRRKGIEHSLLDPLIGENGEWNLKYYYNNFEICSLEFGRSEAYQDYYRCLDETGGIYYKRWGDAPIRTLAVAFLVPEKQRHCFREIGYGHAGYYSKFYLKLIHGSLPFAKHLLGKIGEALFAFRSKGR